MLAYLRDTLGLDVEQYPWEKEAKLPLYLRSGRKYSVLHVSGMECLCVELDAAHFRLSAFQKQQAQLAAYWPGQIVLCFPALTAYQRKVLIKNQISFVVPGSQLYLPWLGMVLQERSQTPTKPVEKLSWNAQLLTLLLLERKWENIRQADLAPLLGVSAMTVSRAVRELNQVELVQTEKSGRDVFLTSAAQEKELWEKAEPYLQNPVRRRIYVNKNTLSPDLPLSGLSALSVRTMLNPPAQSCYAMSGREYKAQNLPAVDPNWTDTEQCAELELWHYDPRLLCGDGAVSSLTLALMYRDSEDERIQQATEEMMEEYQW